jgi:hypothetical protein
LEENFEKPPAPCNKEPPSVLEKSGVDNCLHTILKQTSLVAISLFLTEANSSSAELPFVVKCPFAEPRGIQHRPLDCSRLLLPSSALQLATQESELPNIRDKLQGAPLSLPAYEIKEVDSEKPVGPVVDVVSPFDDTRMQFTGSIPRKDCLDTLLRTLGQDEFFKTLTPDDEHYLVKSIGHLLSTLESFSLSTILGWKRLHTILKQGITTNCSCLVAKNIHDLYWQSKLFIHILTSLRFAALDGQKRMKTVVLMMRGLTLSPLVYDLIPCNQHFTVNDELLKCISAHCFTPNVYVPYPNAKWDAQFLVSVMHRGVELQESSDAVTKCTLADL